MQAGFTNPKGPRHAPPDGWQLDAEVIILIGHHKDVIGLLRERVSAYPSVRGNRWNVLVPHDDESGEVSWKIREYAQSSLRLTHP